jgi:ribonuclease Z
MVNGKKISADDVSRMQKGKTMTYITDTRPNTNSIAISQDADVLLCECVYEHKLAEKAAKHMHLTAREAGLIASKAGVNKLVLTHFSARYKETSVLETDARDVFDNVIAGYDGMKVRL